MYRYKCVCFTIARYSWSKMRQLLCVRHSPAIDRCCVVDVGTGVRWQVTSTNKKKNVSGIILGEGGPCLQRHLVHPSKHKYIWLQVSRLATSAPCLLAPKRARNQNPFYTLWWKWNLEDEYNNPVRQMKSAGYERDGGDWKACISGVNKGKKGARGRQRYLVSSQTLRRRWWSARGSWQVLNLSLLSFRRRGCDTAARKAGNSWCEINEWQLGHNRWRRKYEK